MSLKVKLIRSSTMKCLLNKNVKNPVFNTNNTGNIIYQREENEGILNMLDDFSIDKYSLKKHTSVRSRFRAPISIRWDITYSCNFGCIHCYSSCGFSRNKHLPVSEAKKILDILDKEKVQFVQILGGEPMVYPGILDIIKYALNKKFIFCLNSNGYLLNKEIIKELSILGLKHIQISLYGEEEEHIKITKIPNSFKKTVENIKELLKYDISLSIACVVSDINKNKIFDFMEYLINLGIKNIQLLTPLSVGRAEINNLTLNCQDKKKLKTKLISFKNKHTDINLDLPGFDIDLIDGLINLEENNSDYEFIFGCMGGVSGIRIDPLGNACVCVGGVSNPIANILKEPMIKIMEKMHIWREKNICEICLGCEYYLKDCQGACYLRFGNKNRKTFR